MLEMDFKIVDVSSRVGGFLNKKHDILLFESHLSDRNMLIALKNTAPD